MSIILFFSISFLLYVLKSIGEMGERRMNKEEWEDSVDSMIQESFAGGVSVDNT